MKILLSVYVLSCGCMLCGQVFDTTKGILKEESSLKALRILDRPFTGTLEVVFPRDQGNSKSRSVILNFLMILEGSAPSSTPYIATTNDGKSYSEAYASRGALYPNDRLTEISDYKKIVELLGEPNSHEFTGKSNNMWSYDTVRWRYFAPAGEESIEILEVCVARKIRNSADHKGEYILVSKTVSRGRLIRTRSEQAAPSNR